MTKTTMLHHNNEDIGTTKYAFYIRFHIISGLKTKKCKKLGPAILPCHRRHLLYPTSEQQGSTALYIVKVQVCVVLKLISHSIMLYVIFMFMYQLPRASSLAKFLRSSAFQECRLQLILVNIFCLYSGAFQTFPTSTGTAGWLIILMLL